jgi:hypothetical protein
MKKHVLVGFGSLLALACSAGQPQLDAEEGTSEASISTAPVTSGFATRFWDCCKPTCAWPQNTGGKTPADSCSINNAELSDPMTFNACDGSGSAYACWSFAPWQVTRNLSYGYAAATGVPCGTCLRLDFTGLTHGSTSTSTAAHALAGKSMIVEVVSSGGLANNQVDLMIPGGGVGPFNACAKQWGTNDLGAQYGGFATTCKGDKACIVNKCNAVFGNKPDLLAGCKWYAGWFNAADTPEFTSRQVACPAALRNRSGL